MHHGIGLNSAATDMFGVQLDAWMCIYFCLAVLMLETVSGWSGAVLTKGVFGDVATIS